MTNMIKVIGKIFNQKENSMDFWLDACATTTSKLEERPYKAKHRRYSINRNRRPII